MDSQDRGENAGQESLPSLGSPPPSLDAAARSAPTPPLDVVAPTPPLDNVAQALDGLPGRGAQCRAVMLNETLLRWKQDHML